MYERLEEAVRIVDKEIERTKEKLKRDCENEIDQAEVMKVTSYCSFWCVCVCVFFFFFFFFWCGIHASCLPKIWCYRFLKELQ